MKPWESAASFFIKKKIFPQSLAKMISADAREELHKEAMQTSDYALYDNLQVITPTILFEDLQYCAKNNCKDFLSRYVYEDEAGFQIDNLKTFLVDNPREKITALYILAAENNSYSFFLNLLFADNWVEGIDGNFSDVFSKIINKALDAGQLTFLSALHGYARRNQKYDLKLVIEHCVLNRDDIELTRQVFEFELYVTTTEKGKALDLPCFSSLNFCLEKGKNNNFVYLFTAMDKEGYLNRNHINTFISLAANTNNILALQTIWHKIKALSDDGEYKHELKQCLYNAMVQSKNIDTYEPLIQEVAEHKIGQCHGIIYMLEGIRLQSLKNRQGGRPARAHQTLNRANPIELRLK